MINHGLRGGFMAEMGPLRRWSGLLTPSPVLAHGDFMNGFLAICGISREIMS